MLTHTHQERVLNLTYLKQTKYKFNFYLSQEEMTVFLPKQNTDLTRTPDVLMNQQKSLTQQWLFLKM